MPSNRPPGQHTMVKGDSLFAQASQRQMSADNSERRNSSKKTPGETSDEAGTVPQPTIQRADDPMGTVPVKKIKPKDLDPRMVKLDNLPSLFIPYQEEYTMGRGEFTELYIRPLDWPEIELIAQANATGRVQYLIQAIDATISEDVEVLTIPDFFFILYWQRINSYPSTPYFMPWTCDEVLPNTFSAPTDQETRRERLAADPRGSHVCANDNISPLHEKDLRIITLEDVGWQALATRLDPRVDFPRVNLLPEIDAIQQVLVLEEQIAELMILRENLDAAENPNEQELERIRFTIREIAALNKKKHAIETRWADDNGELTSMEKLNAPAIQWVRAGDTLKEKVAALRSEKGLATYEQALAAEKQWKYGVVEYVNVKCGRCGAGRHYKVTVSASTFLP